VPLRGFLVGAPPGESAEFVTNPVAKWVEGATNAVESERKRKEKPKDSTVRVKRCTLFL
jgi:hypothetical protein